MSTAPATEQRCFLFCFCLGSTWVQLPTATTCCLFLLSTAGEVGDLLGVVVTFQGELQARNQFLGRRWTHLHGFMAPVVFKEAAREIYRSTEIHPKWGRSLFRSTAFVRIIRGAKFLESSEVPGLMPLKSGYDFQSGTLWWTSCRWGFMSTRPVSGGSTLKFIAECVQHGRPESLLSFLRLLKASRRSPICPYLP